MSTLARHLFPLAKPRIVLLLVFTAAAGVWKAAAGQPDAAMLRQYGSVLGRIVRGGVMSSYLATAKRLSIQTIGTAARTTTAAAKKGSPIEFSYRPASRPLPAEPTATPNEYTA